MKLLKIEWIKFKGNRFFWLGFGLYILCMILLIYAIGNFTISIGDTNTPAGRREYSSWGELGFYKLPHIWQNITYLAIWFKFIPAFLLIFFVSNEFSYKTYRQNLIDGLSIEQFYLSKVLSGFLFSFISFLVIGVCILALANSYNEGADITEIWSHSSYLIAYFAEIFFMMMFALFLTILFKRSTITIIVILLYYFIIEPLFAGIISNISGENWGSYLPTQPSRELILQPFTRMLQLDNNMMMESPDSVSLKYLLLTIIYSVIFAFGGYGILKRRDT